MPLEAFEDGRKYEGLVSQLQSLFEMINNSRDREGLRYTLKPIIKDIYPKIMSLARKYNIDNSESGHNVHMYSCCVDEKFYLEYKAQQEQFRKEI